MSKKVVSFFQEKIGVTPSVAAAGDTNLSDATVFCICVATNFAVASCHIYNLFYFNCLIITVTAKSKIFGGKKFRKMQLYEIY